MRADPLVSRVRGEYLEMPGLRLTLAQACRLWQMDAPACDAILQALVAEGFLMRAGDGAFIAVPSVRGITASRTAVCR